MSQELADAVRSAREAAGLTVEQLSARTKIRGVVLRDLEQGSTERSGGSAYARGHLRAIAGATGADPAVLLAAHDAGLPQPAGPLTPGPPGGPRLAPSGGLALPTPARERGGPRWGLALLAAASVLAAFMLIGIFLDRDEPGVADQVASGASPTPTLSAAAAPPAAAPPPAPAAAALRLAVSGGPSWVDVLSEAGETLFRGVLPAGAQREFSDPTKLSVTVGNAGAVTLGCGGTDVPAGRRGQVKKFTCAPDGLAPA